jgi:hypothetical protein
MTFPGPLWQPSTEDDLRSAAENGVLEETHYLDLKRELGKGKSANADIAKDIAAFSIDGGSIVIGVDEDSDPPSLHPVELGGLAERIEQVAWTKIEGGVWVSSTPIRSAADPAKGYLIVHVPVSPRAPHMVDGRYYARGDKTNRVMSDQDVRRYLERQREGERDVLAEAAALVPTATLRGRMGLLAVPIGAPEDMLVPLSASSTYDATLAELIQRARVADRQAFPDTLTERVKVGRSAAGVVISKSVTGPRDAVARMEFRESGELALTAEGLWESAPIPYGNTTVVERFIHEEVVLGHLDFVMRAAAEVSRRWGFLGVWRFGVVIYDLAGGIANGVEFDPRDGRDRHRYGASEYRRSRDASTVELVRSPESVTSALVAPLLRGLDANDVYEWLNESKPDSDGQ